MSRITAYTPLLIVPLIVALVLISGPATVYAHARYERSEPMAGAMVDAAPSTMRAWFTQELMLRSGIVVTDEAGNQVDLGDGRVDQDDPNRKSMLVSLPSLPNGVYWVYYLAASAEDGHDESGYFTFGVGMTPPIAESPATTSTGPAASAPRGWSSADLLGEL